MTAPNKTEPTASKQQGNAEHDAISALDRLLTLLAERQMARGEKALRAALVTDRADEILATAAALRFKRALPERPVFVGLLGCASVGKSLLFNSLIGQELSQVRYEPHTSQGGLLFLHRDDWQHISDEESHQPAPFGLLARAEVVDLTEAQPVKGVPSHLTVILHARQDLGGVALMDLPDISSGAASRDPVARRLLPWLDGVLIVVSCDTINGREYDEHAARLQRLGVWCRGVLNNLEGEKLSDGGATPRRARERFESLGATPCYTLPFLGRARDFSQVKEKAGEFTLLRDQLRGGNAAKLPRSDQNQLLQFFRDVAADAPAAMKEREYALSELHRAAEEIMQRSSQTLPPLVRPEDVVPPERRRELMKVGYNPYRVLTAISGIGKRFKFLFGRGERPEDRMFDEDSAVQIYGRHLVAFESDIRKRYGQDPLVRNAANESEPVLPSAVAGTIDYADEVHRLISNLRDRVGAFLERKAKEFESSLSRTKRYAWYTMLTLSTGLAVADLFTFPGLGTAAGAGLFAALQAIYPELRAHVKEFQPIADEFGEDVQSLYRRHLERIVATYSGAVSVALPTDVSLRHALEEALA